MKKNYYLKDQPTTWSNYVKQVGFLDQHQRATLHILLIS